MFLLTGVKVGLEALVPGTSLSTGKSNSGEKITEAQKSHSVPSRTVQMSATSKSKSNKVMSVLAAGAGDFVPSKMHFTGDSFADSMQQWRFDDFLALTDLNQDYNYLDNGSSKADSGKLAESDISVGLELNKTITKAQKQPQKNRQ